MVQLVYRDCFKVSILESAKYIKSYVNRFGEYDKKSKCQLGTLSVPLKHSDFFLKFELFFISNSGK